MKATTILNTLLHNVTPNMHSVRRTSLYTMVHSLISGAGLSVTSIGRNIESNTTEKHQIKRSMRLCSNHYLQDEMATIYSLMTSYLIGAQQQPIILVGWSDLDPRKQHFLLRASVAIQGRALTVLEKIYPLSKKEKPTVHKQFMITLKTMLPSTCKPIIVSDAGFRGQWFELIRSLGWDYVGRVRNCTYCQSENSEQWQPIKSLYTMATRTAKSLGTYQLCRSTPLSCQLIIYQGVKKGRHHLTATCEKPRKGKPSRVHAKREKEPWLLATSLPSSTAKEAKKIVKLYQTRMQIEESFRDLKSGLNFNGSNTRTLNYLAVLLLLAMLAQYVLFLLGMAVKLSKQHLRYQASSVKKGTVLSYQFIGLRAFKDRFLKLRKADWQAAYSKIQQLMRKPLNV